MNVQQGIDLISTNGLAVFLVLWWVIWGSKKVDKMTKAFESMNQTMVIIKNYLEKFITGEINKNE